MPRDAYRHSLSLVLVILFSIVLRAGIASIPLERDEGEYAYIAQRWLAGDLPYRDAFDQKPPGVFVAYAALFSLGFKSIEAIHWLGHLHVLGTLVFVYLIGRRLFSHTVGWIAALFTVVFVMDSTVLGNAANTEVFAIFPMAAGMYFALRAAADGDWQSSLLTGISGGAALCFKQVTLPVVAFCFAWILLSRWHRWGRTFVAVAPRSVSADPRDPLSQASYSLLVLVGMFVAGLCAVIVPTCIYFVWRDAGTEFYDCVIGHNLDYSGRMPLVFYIPMLCFRGQAFLPVFGPIYIAAVFGLVAASRRVTARIRLCLWWWLSSFLAVSVGGIYREHYFILLWPATAVIAAYGVDVFALRLQPRRKEWRNIVATGLAVTAAIWPVYLHRAYYWGDSPERVCRMLYGACPFPESIGLAKLLQENSTPSDKIFIFGSEPQVLFYADRASATRYIFVYPLFSGASDAQRRQRAVAEEFKRELPKFVVMVQVPSSFCEMPGSPPDLLNEVTETVNAAYTPFVVVTLGNDGTTRTVRPQNDENGQPVFVVPEDETVSMKVWERRASN